MRILAISDSHRRTDIVERIIKQHPAVRDVFFLGDLTADIEDLQVVFPNRNFHIVCGNCDYYSNYPTSDIAYIGNHKIFYTHGHTLGVKYGTGRLLENAVARGCTIALYGHTHVSNTVYENGVYLVNPGSCSAARNGANSYAVIDLEPSGVMPIIIKTGR